MALAKNKETFEAKMKKYDEMREDNEKSAQVLAKIERSRQQYIMQNQGFAQECGINLGNSVTRVVTYAGFGHIHEVNTNLTGEQYMRLSHEYYNDCAEALQPMVKKFWKMINGPIGMQFQKLSNDINTLYDTIRKIKSIAFLQKNATAEMKEVTDKQISDIKDQISVFQNLKSEIILPMYDERRQNMKKHAEEILALKDEKNAIITGCRAKIREQKLYAGAYKAIEAAVNASYKKVTDTKNIDRLEMRYRYGDIRTGNPPSESMLTYPKWDGEGTIYSNQISVNYSVKDIMNRINTIVQIRKYNPQVDNEIFGMKSSFTEKKVPLYIVAIADAMVHDSRGKASIKTWYEIPMFMHRPLSDNDSDSVLGVKVVRTKVGFKHSFEIQFCIKKEVFFDRITNKKKEVFITPTFETLENNDLQFCTWTDNSGTSGNGIIPSNLFVDKKMTQNADLQRRIQEHLSMMKNYLDSNKLYNSPELQVYAVDITSGRSQMRYAFRDWTNKLITSDKSKYDDIKHLRYYARDRHLEKSPDGKFIPYGGDYEAMVDHIATNIGKLFPTMNQTSTYAYAALLIFNERFSHLYTFYTDASSKAERQRKEEFRKFAKSICDTYNNVTITNVNFATRRITPTQKIIAPSIFVSVLESTAGNNGVRLIKLKEKKANIRKVRANS
jgi:hypothetical protein